MKKLMVLLVGLIVLGTSGYARAVPCGGDVCFPPNLDQPILGGMEGEKYMFELIADLPLPTPYPQAVKDLLNVADGFGVIALHSLEFRTIRFRANLPGPLPGPGSFAFPVPRPTALATQARQLKRWMRLTLEDLEVQIEEAFDKGLLSPDDYAYLTTLRDTLESLVSDLPGPLP